MRIVTSLFPGVIEIEEDQVFSLVIENKELYLRFLKDMYRQTLGDGGETILSEDDKVINFSAYVEMIMDYVRLEPDSKRLQGRLCKRLEEEINRGETYPEIMQILSNLEKVMYQVTECFPFTLSFDGISIPNLMKMVSPKYVDDSSNEVERVLNYMELCREMMGERLFVMVGMKSFYSSEGMQNFIDSVVLHKYRVLLIDSSESDILKNERRMLIDNDICVI